ncbi:MAG: flagellar brake protein [Herminiimonas sp.]|nr:flagellar brake protein [Herminiimonas sp.]
MDALQDKLSQDLAPYQVHSRREITALLRNICDQKQLINLTANRGNVSIVTAILAIDEVAGNVIIDATNQLGVKQNIIDSDSIAFETALEQIRILFFATRVESCLYAELPAFRITLPQTLIRLQRREYYRVPTPLVMPVSCSITIPQASTSEHHSINVVLQNVSGGGIAIIDEHGVLDQTVGRVYRDCRIDLPGGTLVVASLEIRNAHEVRLHNGKHVRRLGCLFVDLPHAMLAAVQRYITKLEREQNARTAGRMS